MPDFDPWATAADVRTADRWRSAAAHWGTALTQALLDSADLRRNSFVLDVAAGSGDPALYIAQRVTEGSVVALDSSRRSLLLAKRRADEMGLGPKLRFVEADVHQLPFSGSCFDRVTCRCGIMFFADVDTALKGMLRVLKPGGRAAFLAWGPFQQPFFDRTFGTILRLIPKTTLPESARAMFRFATRGSLQTALDRAGFCNAEERHPTLPRVWAGSPQQLWQYQREISTLFHPLLEAIPPAMLAQVDEAVCASLARFQSGPTITTPAQVVVATAES
ncbi:MAG: methyltransferase domain-containing protein [Candidatus Acidiferrales bacterium]